MTPPGAPGVLYDRCGHQHNAAQSDEREEPKHNRCANNQSSRDYNEYIGNRVACRETVL